MMKNILTLTILTLITTYSAAESENPRQRRGLLPHTQEHLRKMKQEFREVQSVEPNDIGLHRINQERRKHRLPEFKHSPRKKGEETTVGPEGQNGATGGDITTTTTTQTQIMAVPGVVDNSTLPSFPAISWQGYLASCVAYSSVYYQLTHNMGLLHGRNVKSGDPSLIYSPKFVYNMINKGVDNGSYAYDAFKVLQYHGAPALSDWAYDSNYTQWPTDSGVWRKALSQRVGSVQTISSMDTATGVSNLKSILNNGYVVTVATWIDSWSYGTIQNDPSTTSDDTELGKSIVKGVYGQSGGHMMTIVGYNDHVWVDLNGNGVIDSGEKGAFRLANSWGTGWQDKGFVWVSYDSFKAVSAVSGVNNTSRVRFSQDNATYHFVPKTNYQPTLLAEMTLSHLKRNQLGLRFGKGSISSTSPSSYVTPGAFRFQGGSLAFDGTTAETRTNVVLDLTDVVGSTVDNSVYYVEVQDNTSGDSLSHQGYRLTDGYGTLIANATDYAYPMTIDGSTKVTKVVVPGPPDSAAPTASVTVQKGSRNYTFTAQASDNVGVTKVEFWLDGRLIATDTTVTYSASVRVSSLATGSHTIQVRAYDQSGNIGYSTVGFTK